MKKSLIPAVTQALAVLSVVLPGGCTKELTERPPSRRPLVVYMALDNNLREEYSSRLAALRAGWRPGMELWVYADTPEGASLGRMESAPEGVTLRTVERYGAEGALPHAIAVGLRRHLDGEDGREGRGIPYAFRWLRDRRWTEKRKTAGRGEAAGPPEVSYGWR